MAVSAGVTASLFAAAPAGASAAEAGRGGCVVFDNLTETVLEATYDDVAPEGISVGDGGTWHNTLTTEDGEFLADVTGSSRALFEVGEELYTLQDNTDTLADGVVRSVGVTETFSLIDGEKQSIPAWGVSGRYAGLVGERTFQKTGEDVYVSSLRLCRVR
ncbi:allene oxide cyclase barrel-like domain-containing protein [Streptomyces sp. 6N223]|uniref:allene oxide cyclase barrel-like domain-containing protein n=1 Tax=Streptomyces sp. 6N223 TaxID=3457412 RepID=UPI003FCFF05A